MKQAAQKHGKKPLIIVLSVVILLLATLGILFGLALNDPNVPITADETDTAVAKIITAAAAGKPTHLSAEEMGAILTAKLAQSKQTKVRGVRFSINSNNTVDAYLPVVYKGVKFGVSANLMVSSNTAEKQICAVVNSIKVGRLPVNPVWLLQYGKAELPNSVSANGNVLRVNTSLFSTYVLGDMVGVDINAVTVADPDFVVSVSGNLDKLKEYITQNLKSYIGLLG